MKRRLVLLMTCMLFSIGLALAQNKRISGTVVDNNGQALTGATVLVKGTTVGTSTDIDGKFSMSVPQKAKTLVVSLIGSKAKEVAVGENLKIVLENDSKALDEVMVVAFGTSKKSAFTGSASVVSSEDLSKQVTTNIADALVGTVPGLQMRGGSGAPGASQGSINIRGIASMYSGTNPLIIVDGAPYESSLSNIPQSDIESISILKDAASAALYGARGAAGVIIVTTKKGKSKEATINVDLKWGANTRAVQDYDVIKDPGAYYEAYYKQLYNYYYYDQGNSVATSNQSANTKMISDLGYNVYTVPDGQQLIGTDGKLNPNATLGRKYTYDGTEYYLQPDNWTDLAYKTAFRKEYNVSINGGTDVSSMYASIGYLDEDGIIEYSGYKRITGRLKADYQAKKWLKITGNIGYVHSNQNSNPNMDTTLGSTNLMYYTSMIAPIYPVFVRVVDAEGNVGIKQDQYGHDAYDYGVASSNYGVTRAFLTTGNPLGSNKYNSVTSIGDQLNASFVADGNITDFLKYSVTSTVIWGGTNSSDYENPFYGPKVSVNGQITKANTTTLRTNNIQTLTYFKDFDQHSLSVMLGHEYYKTKKKYLDAIAQGGFSPDVQEIDAFAKTVDSHSYTTSYNVEGYFGSAQYNYAQKYFASASYRRDASSRFRKEHRWGNFWSLGSAWLLSKENFMRPYSWIDQLKLKASIGQQGNDNLQSSSGASVNWAYTDLYSLSPASDTQMSPSFAQIGNPDITWETTTNINIGTEFSLWKGRLSGSLDFYTKKTTNLLFWLSVPESAGSRGYYGNIGDIRNAGVELALTGFVVRNKNVDWSVSANISHNDTKILKLPQSKITDKGGFNESNTDKTFQYWYREGGSLYNAFLPKYAGVDEKGMATYWVDETLNGATNQPGREYSSRTTNVNNASKYELGSMLPKAFGGFGTNLRVGNFDASVTFDYQLGGKVFDLRYMYLMSPIETSSDAGSNIHKDYAKAWSPNNTSSNIPRWQYGDQYSAAKSDRFLTNASYLNFQSFNVGYTFPKDLLKGLSKIRVYATGENLGFISARKGLDPRYSYDGNTAVNVYSPVRNISGGVQLSF